MAQSKEKTSLGCVNGKILVDAVCHIKFRKAFLDMINHSLKSGEFPEEFKSSTIVPLKKVQNTIKCDEIRSINRLRIEESILERVVKIQIVDHFETNDLFMPEQSGFRQKHSCETALNRVIYDWKKALDDKKIIVAVFLDLKRAFETIDRELLIKKIKSYGCDTVSLKWFNSFLSNRKQKTKINEFFSSEIINEIGIPQGSVLSCILFIIFINDIKSVIKYCDVKFFADDGLIQIICENISEGIEKLNFDLNNIFNYLCHSRLSLNVSKTKFMVITNRKLSGDVDVKINLQSLERESEFKYLGIILDDRLTLNPFTDDICRKLNKKFGVFKRCEKKLPFFSKLTFYNSLVQSHIDTSGSTFFCLNLSQLSRIQLIQNRFMRSILRAESRRSISSMLEELKWMSIKQRVNWNCLKFIHKLQQGYGPNYLLSLLNTVGDNHHYDTRQRENFYIDHANLVSTDKSIFRDGLRLFDEVKLSYRREKEEKIVNLGFYNYLKYYVKENF